MNQRITKKLMLPVILLLISSILLNGCGLGTGKTTKLRDLEFTVVSEEKLPEELKKLIDERKNTPFKITYNDKEYLYICVGYGEQSTGGYSITVDELYLTDDAIYISTSLLGPGPEDKTGAALSYPYIVVKTEYMDKQVMVE